MNNKKITPNRISSLVRGHLNTMKKNYDTKRGIAGNPVENANYGVFGLVLIKIRYRLNQQDIPERGLN